MIFLSSIIKYKFLKLKLIEVESHTFDFRGTSIVDHKAVNSLVVDTVRARHKVDHTVVLEGAITSIAREVAGNIKASLQEKLEAVDTQVKPVPFKVADTWPGYTHKDFVLEPSFIALVFRALAGRTQPFMPFLAWSGLILQVSINFTISLDLLVFRDIKFHTIHPYHQLCTIQTFLSQSLQPTHVIINFTLSSLPTSSSKT